MCSLRYLSKYIFFFFLFELFSFCCHKRQNEFRMSEKQYERECVSTVAYVFVHVRPYPYNRSKNRSQLWWEIVWKFIFFPMFNIYFQFIRMWTEFESFIQLFWIRNIELKPIWRRILFFIVYLYETFEYSQRTLKTDKALFMSEPHFYFFSRSKATNNA